MSSTLSLRQNLSSLSVTEQKDHLLKLLDEKKSQLKTLQDKCELQNKKIKLFRKQNEDLTEIINQKSQIDTNTLLQSKQLLSNNSKLQKTIQQLKQQLKTSKINFERRNQIKNNSNQSNHNNDKIEKQTKSKLRGPMITTIRQVSVTQNTLQLDLPNLKIQDHEFLKLQPFVQIKTMILNDNILKNESIQLICNKFVNLQKLNISNNQFTHQSLKNISNLKQLKVLDIRNNNLGDEALKHISSLFQKMEQLSCSKNQLTDKGAEYIGQLSKLKYLDITNNIITSVGAQIMIKGLKSLTHLYLMSNKLCVKGILVLMNQGQKLQFLDVRFNVWNNDQKQEIRSNKKAGMQIFC